MDIFTVTRARFAKKSDKCVYSHTLNFKSEDEANTYMQSMKRMDSMILANVKKNFEYFLECKGVY